MLPSSDVDARYYRCKDTRLTAVNTLLLLLLYPSAPGLLTRSMWGPRSGTVFLVFFWDNEYQEMTESGVAPALRHYSSAIFACSLGENPSKFWFWFRFPVFFFSLAGISQNGRHQLVLCGTFACLPPPHKQFGNPFPEIKNLETVIYVPSRVLPIAPFLNVRLNRRRGPPLFWKR